MTVCAQSFYIGIYKKKSDQVNFLRSNNNVSIVIELILYFAEILYLRETNFWLRPC